jgi:hypothetical protein
MLLATAEANNLAAVGVAKDSYNKDMEQVWPSDTILAWANVLFLGTKCEDCTVIFGTKCEDLVKVTH